MPVLLTQNWEDMSSVFGCLSFDPKLRRHVFRRRMPVFWPSIGKTCRINFGPVLLTQNWEDMSFVVGCPSFRLRMPIFPSQDARLSILGDPNLGKNMSRHHHHYSTKSRLEEEWKIWISLTKKLTPAPAKYKQNITLNDGQVH